VDALKLAGASVRIENNRILVSKSEMKGFVFDATDAPDLFPPLVALAAYCKGESRIKGVSRLVHKESNRAVSLKEEFEKLNIRITIEDDFMNVYGGNVKGGKVSSHDDHRIAMALAVTALGADSRVSIKDSHSVAKSYPGFFDDLRSIGAAVYE
jgi:3-phosphoshikimate 1-carboxyvinyltransferase